MSQSQGKTIYSLSLFVAPALMTFAGTLSVPGLYLLSFYILETFQLHNFNFVDELNSLLQDSWLVLTKGTIQNKVTTAETLNTGVHNRQL